MPLVLKVGENVDSSHDLKVQIFAHNGRLLYVDFSALSEFFAEIAPDRLD